MQAQQTMFTVLKFNECGITGFVDVEVVFDTPSGQSTDKKSFRTAQDARVYLDQSKKNYILTKFKHFVNHKSILFDTGKKAYYGATYKRYALDKCMVTLSFISTLKHSGDICRNILKVEDALEKIIPNPTNPSYNSSLLQLDEIISFCKKNAT